MRAFRDRYEHHLILKMPAAAITETRALLTDTFDSPDAGFFECTADEARKAFLHRFVTAGAAVRYRAVHRDEVEDIVALDIALPRNAREWREVLPEEISAGIIHAFYYGHFFCHVFHQDYIVRKGVDPLALEHRMWALLDERGAEYPAEHNVGHLYHAKPGLADFYRTLDPCNQLNPGIGHTPRQRGWSNDD
jgi:D-lactate dehydrogenase